MTASDVSAFAEALRAGREAKGWTVPKVANQLLLSDMQVYGLEADDHSAFYGTAYAQRAAIAYAALLELQPDLPGGPPFTSGQPLDAQAAPLLHSLRSATRIGPQFPRSLIAGAGLVLVVAAGLWVRHAVVSATRNTAAVAATTDTQGVAPAEAAVVPVAAPVALDPPTPPQSAEQSPADDPLVDSTPDAETDRGDKSLRFYLVINSTAVVNAFDGEGNRLLGGRQSPMPGQSYAGKPPFSLQTNDAEAIELYYMGSRVRPAEDANGGYSTRFGPPPRQP